MSFTGEVIANERHTKDVHVLKVYFPQLENFSHLPGQFAVLMPKNIGRAYSIANYPANGYLEFCIKKVPGGKVSPKLCAMKEGDKIKVFAPFGDFVLKKPLKKDLLFICSGTGIAPIKAMLECVLREKLHKEINVSLIYGVRDREYPYKDFLEKLRKKGINVEITSSVENSVKKFASLKNFEVYLCGSPFFVKDIFSLCKKKEASKIYYEKAIFRIGEMLKNIIKRFKR